MEFLFMGLWYNFFGWYLLLDETEEMFRRLLADAGYSKKVIKELWKWYGPSEGERGRPRKQDRVSWPWVWD